MKKILMLLQGEFPPDIRLEKEIKSLVQNNFEVVLLCNNFSNSVYPKFEYGLIKRMPAFFNNPGINKIINFPIVFNPFFLFFVLINTLREKPEFIHSHDLPMVPFGVLLKYIMKSKLVFDMHENYPEALKAYKKKNLAEKILKNPAIAKFVEKHFVKHCDRIIVVVEENMERLIKDGYLKEKIVLVSNTVDLESFHINSGDSTSANKNQDEFSMIYTGRVSANRGLDTPIRALNLLSQEIPNIKLYIVGHGPSRPYLEALSRDLKVDNYVDFIDWPGHYKIAEFIQNANICLIPQPSNGHADTTVPHKLFEYMSQGKTILTSDAKPLKRIVEETQCGKYFISDDENSFTEKVMEIRSSDINYGINGVKAVQNKYNWTVDERQFISMYKSLN